MPELNLVLLGPPGSGKGTQGERLNEDLRLPYYATGDILRAAVARRNRARPHGEGYMDRGDLVPDEVIVGVIAEALDSEEARDGFILDGFPRTTPQAEALDAKLDELGRGVTAVLLIDVSDDEVVRRLGGRRTCAENGHVFHVEFNPPKQEGVCDIDGSELIVRDDDKPGGDPQAPRAPTTRRPSRWSTTTTSAASCAGSTASATPDEVAEEIRRTLATMRLEQDEAV